MSNFFTKAGKTSYKSKSYQNKSKEFNNKFDTKKREFRKDFKRNKSNFSRNDSFSYDKSFDDNNSFSSFSKPRTFKNRDGESFSKSRTFENRNPFNSFNRFNKPFNRYSDNNNFRRKKEKNSIDIAIYTNKSIKKENIIKSQTNFESIGLNQKILNVLKNRGYVEPTPIQIEVIPKILNNQNVIGVSQTGSGKTGGFLIPLLNKHLNTEDRIQTLILVPTRELAMQTEKELHKLELKKHRLFSILIVGGMSMSEQIRFTKKHNDFIIATPGRLKDLITRGVMSIENVQHLVLDEMDRMLDMGFIKDIQWIIDKLPEDRQTVCFSATVNSKIKPLLKEITKDADIIGVDKSKPSENVEQSMVRVSGYHEKNQLLLDILSEKSNKSIVFINTKTEVEKIALYLKDNGHNVEFIHGDRTQKQRINAIKYYSQKDSGILVATDVAARGIDIDNITQVINYDEPKTIDDYIHRVGRTGRAGNFGKAITFVNR